ncbi:MarR family winged helix-turn-helix transcriptional regulator [Terrabacter sp. 2RAF25]|uniref:MarR family winged helix-turn-helix transcriptional regulator n=1 Tax=Terrabacter sp. 2RAF25 TaxID=3232998 RepID=UPI003F9EA2DE
MTVSKDEANDVFLGLLRVQKLLVAARNTAPRLEDGIDVTAYPVLFVVAGAGTVRISEIATTLHNDVSTVSRQVSALVAVELLEKSADPNDGRASVVSMTERGREALDRIQASRAKWFQGLLSDWESPETAAFVARLRELGDVLDANLRARGAAPPPMPFHTTRQLQHQNQKED